VSWDGLQGSTLTHAQSTLESERFGMSIGRVVVGQDVLEADVAQSLRELLDNAPEELLIVRWPSRMSSLGSAAAASSRAIIPADVLMYWEIAPDHLHPAPDVLAALELSIRVPANADAAARNAVDEVVRDSFREYGNHYTANPALDRDLALEGYIEWAQRSLTDNPQSVVLLLHQDRPVGVATTVVGARGGDLEILLAGLTGAAQGRGWYQHLLSGVASQARASGSRRLIISTQAHNIRVQRAWAREGFRPFEAVTTVHAVRRG
jgi:GNAT superfamily N-acetyltransferase